MCDSNTQCKQIRNKSENFSLEELCVQLHKCHRCTTRGNRFVHPTTMQRTDTKVRLLYIESHYAVLRKGQIYPNKPKNSA
ncbi:MAG: hypothetical protein PHS10_07010 [Thiovulaceae bacterium]|nr:hypothetical protein [Sulfurimonadaceae bacterium]